MASNATSVNDELLAGRAVLPDHVVYRAFVKETVVLNLQTGKYHGLNPTAGRMLDMLERSPTVREAAQRLAEAYAQPLATIETDLCDLCRELVARGLIELVDAEPARE